MPQTKPSLASLYATVMLHYRTPKGDAAWGEIGKMIGPDNVSSFAFLMGYIMGCKGTPTRDDWERLQQLEQIE